MFSRVAVRFELGFTFGDARISVVRHWSYSRLKIIFEGCVSVSKYFWERISAANIYSIFELQVYIFMISA